MIIMITVIFTNRVLFKLKTVDVPKNVLNMGKEDERLFPFPLLIF